MSGNKRGPICGAANPCWKPTAGPTGCRDQGDPTNPVRIPSTRQVGHVLEDLEQLAARSSLDRPKFLTPETVAMLFNPDPGGRIYIGPRWGYIERGQIWLGPDGKRLILGANNVPGVIYIRVQTGRAYLQTKRGFISDVVTEPLSRAGKAARSLATIIEYQMQFLIGIASCASGGVFLAVLSTDAAKFYIKNVDKLDKWYKALRVAIEVRSTLRRVAPTLYDKLIDRVLIQVYQSVMELPKEMLNDPKIAGRGLGVLLAKLGKKTLAARLSALSIVWSVLWAFLKSAVGKIPAAVKTKTINDIYAALKSGDIGLSRDEVKKILEEIQSHPEEIKSALGKLIDAFQGV